MPLALALALSLSVRAPDPSLSLQPFLEETAAWEAREATRYAWLYMIICSQNLNRYQ